MMEGRFDLNEDPEWNVPGYEWSSPPGRDCGPDGGKGLMDWVEEVLRQLDTALDTRRKRHIMGGIMLSASLLFGGLAVTIMTIGEKEE